MKHLKLYEQFEWNDDNYDDNYDVFYSKNEQFDWSDEDFDEEEFNDNLNGIKIGDRVDSLFGKGTVIAIGNDKYCVEFDNFTKGHDGNGVKDINGNIVNYGKKNHCWWIDIPK